MMRFVITLLLGLSLTACERADGPEILVTKSDIEKASQGADLGELKKALESVQKHHLAANTGIRLNPGADAAAIENLEREIQCQLPLELKEMWMWHNGESTEKFIWYHRFLSIGEALSQYRKLTSDGRRLWRSDWVPVFEFQEEWYGVQCGKENNLASPVIFYFIEDEPRIVYVNLTCYMKTMARAMKEGVLVWNGYAWEEDIVRLAEIHSRLNPDLRFPYHVPEKREQGVPTPR